MPLTNVSQRFEQFKDVLSETDNRIGSWMFSNPSDATRLSIKEISERIGVAQSSVSRFVRRLGYKSLRELRNDMLRSVFDPASSIESAIEPTDSSAEILRKTYNTSIRFLSAGLEMIDGEAFEKAVNTIAERRRVTLFGVGTSGLSAQTAYRNFVYTSIKPEYDPDPHTQRSMAARLGDQDVALVISAMGQSPEIDVLLDELSDSKCALIALTTNASSRLAKRADVLLLQPSLAGRESFSEIRAMYAAQVVFLNALSGAVGAKLARDAYFDNRQLQALRRIHL
ncbi:MAG: MurR/RpiR family transcriptional regulator [Atopobiaceae bacterium]|nr:MurR/RpiR family transcriptional regulator [Atopobiaceae bacterium]